MSDDIFLDEPKPAPGVQSAIENAEAELENLAEDEPEDLFDTPPGDPVGTVTALSPDLFGPLQVAWKKQGSPRRFDYGGYRWMMLSRGAKFVRVVDKGGLEGLYSTTSVSRGFGGR